jgi:MFS family permease
VFMRRLGQKETMLVGAAVAALATAALFLAGSVPTAVALRIIAGFSRALFTVSRHAYVAGIASVGRRGRAIALFGGLMRIGSFLGPLAGGVMAASYGLRSTFLVFGAANLAAMAAMAVFVRASSEERSAPSLRGHADLLLTTLKERYRVLIASGGGQLLAQMIRAGRSAIIPLYAADVVGLDVTAIGAIVSLSSAVDMSLFYPAGWIMDHLGRKFAIVPSFLIQAVGMFLIPFTTSFGSLLAAAAVIGFGNGLGSGSMMTLGADLAPKHARGEFLGIWRLIGDVGQTGGPILVGQVADLVALPTAAWAIGAAGLCAGLIFWRLVPEPLKARAQESQVASAEG